MYSKPDSHSYAHYPPTKISLCNFNPRDTDRGFSLHFPASKSGSGSMCYYQGGRFFSPGRAARWPLPVGSPPSRAPPHRAPSTAARQTILPFYGIPAPSHSSNARAKKRSINESAACPIRGNATARGPSPQGPAAVLRCSF
jgi:hypothetical protein